MQHNEHYGAFFMGKNRIKKAPFKGQMKRQRILCSTKGEARSATGAKLQRSRVAQKKLTKCQVFLGQANREHLCSMEPFRNIKAKRNPPRRTIDEATETFLRFQKRSSKLVSRQEFSRQRILRSMEQTPVCEMRQCESRTEWKKCIQHF